MLLRNKHLGFTLLVLEGWMLLKEAALTSSFFLRVNDLVFVDRIRVVLISVGVVRLLDILSLHLSAGHGLVQLFVVLSIGLLFEVILVSMRHVRHFVVLIVRVLVCTLVKSRLTDLGGLGFLGQLFVLEVGDSRVDSDYVVILFVVCSSWVLFDAAGTFILLRENLLGAFALMVHAITLARVVFVRLLVHMLTVFNEMIVVVFVVIFNLVVDNLVLVLIFDDLVFHLLLLFVFLVVVEHLFDGLVAAHVLELAILHLLELLLLSLEGHNSVFLDQVVNLILFLLFLLAAADVLFVHNFSDVVSVLLVHARQVGVPAHVVNMLLIGMPVAHLVSLLVGPASQVVGVGVHQVVGVLHANHVVIFVFLRAAHLVFGSLFLVLRHALVDFVFLRLLPHVCEVLIVVRDDSFFVFTLIVVDRNVILQVIVLVLL